MRLTTEYFNKIVETLGDLYPLQQDIHALLLRIGIPSDKIQYQGRGETIWSSALDYIDKQHKQIELIQLVAAEFPSNVSVKAIGTAIDNKMAFKPTSITQAKTKETKPIRILNISFLAI